MGVVSTVLNPPTTGGGLDISQESRLSIVVQSTSSTSRHNLQLPNPSAPSADYTTHMLLTFLRFILTVSTYPIFIITNPRSGFVPSLFVPSPLIAASRISPCATAGNICSPLSHTCTHSHIWMSSLPLKCLLYIFLYCVYRENVSHFANIHHVRNLNI